MILLEQEFQDKTDPNRRWALMLEHITSGVYGEITLFDITLCCWDGYKVEREKLNSGNNKRWARKRYDRAVAALRSRADPIDHDGNPVLVRRASNG